MAAPTAVPTGPTAEPAAAPAALAAPTPPPPPPAAPTPVPTGCDPGAPVIGSGFESFALVRFDSVAITVIPFLGSALQRMCHPAREVFAGEKISATAAR